jgi:hypothetical protein
MSLASSLVLRVRQVAPLGGPRRRQFEHEFPVRHARAVAGHVGGTPRLLTIVAHQGIVGGRAAAAYPRLMARRSDKSARLQRDPSSAGLQRA